MRKHFPGPWELTEGPANTSSLCVRTSLGRPFVTIKLLDGMDYYAMAATARLVASAPDLLQALEDIVAILDRKTVEFDAARAAIAKARGES